MQQQFDLDESKKQSTGVSQKDTPTLPFFLKGSIERVIYFNEENGQCVLDIKLFVDNTHVLVTTRTPSAFAGQTAQATVPPSEIKSGFLMDGPVFVSDLKLSTPQGSRTVKKFLKSGALAGIGPNLATLLAKAHPEDLFEIFDYNPRLLLEISGVGQKRQAQILDAWKDFKDLSALETFLFEENLPLNWGKLIFPMHKKQSIDFLKNRPYEAVSRHSLDFEVIDSFALKNGLPPDSPERVRGCLYDVLQSSYKQGHCAYPEARLLQQTRERLQISLSLVEESLELELISENLISDTIETTPCLYLKEVWKTERQVSEKLLSFEKRVSPWGGFNSEKFLNWAQELLQIQLAPLQREAIATALTSPLAVITGGPGTGKTTLIQSLVTILQTQFMKFALCSPTGRAAQPTRCRARSIRWMVRSMIVAPPDCARS
ncbi:MAG: helix-hairpin-helix domain-containing protein [Pseudobdellovibrionaceae bacterium]